MEAGFPAFRDRKSRWADYMPLDSDSDADSFRRSHPSIHQPPHRSRDDRKLVSCDKCWLQNERALASKWCLDCKQNICKACANCEMVKKPWWMPACIAYCWRMLFASACKMHSVVDLVNYGGVDRPSSRQSPHANRMHPIPRVRQSSFRSDTGGNHIMSRENRAPRRERGRSSSWSNGKPKRHKKSSGSIRSDTNIPSLHHSRSFDGELRRRRVGLNRYPAVGNVGPVAHIHRHDDIERLRNYRDNWEKSFDPGSHDFTQCPFQNKMRGNDITIELSDHDAKVIVNTLGGDKKKKGGSGKRNSKRKSKFQSSDNITEDVFKEVPIWFKKDTGTNSSNDSRRRESSNGRENTKGVPKHGNGKFPYGSRDDLHYDSQRGDYFGHMPFFDTNFYHRRDFHLNNDRSRKAQYPSPTDAGFTGYSDQPGRSDAAYSSSCFTNYIVEEPADTCDICQKELPGIEARTLSCAHGFHTRCLLHLLKTTEFDFCIQCPVCSEKTPIKNYYASKEEWVRELPVVTTV